MLWVSTTRKARWLALAVLAGLCGPLTAGTPSAQGDPACHGRTSTPLPPQLRQDGLDFTDGGTLHYRLAGLVDEVIPGRDAAIAAWLAESQPRAAPLKAAKPDRYGAQPVFFTASDSGGSLQENLLEAGLARLRHAGLSQSCFVHLRQFEAKAIAAGHGVWRDPRFAVLRAWDVDAMAPRIDSYQLVEGRILSTGRTSRRFYLNFGEYWAEDFTVEVGRRGETALQKAGIRLEDWVGARIRVRGWLSESRGPMIRIESPNQIERRTD